MHWLTVLEVSHLKFSYYLWAENVPSQILTPTKLEF